MEKIIDAWFLAYFYLGLSVILAFIATFWNWRDEEKAYKRMYESMKSERERWL